MKRRRTSLLATMLIAAVLAAGCGSAPAPADRAPAAPAAPAAAAAQDGCLALAPDPPGDARRVTVTRVVDGDTVELKDSTKVRLIGMNTPESVDPRRPVQAYGKEASAYTKELLQGKEVLLREGQTPKDKYGRTLAWLWLPDGRFVNALLVQQGYAQVYTFADNPDHADLLLVCEREAREGGRGLWALPGGELTLLKEPGTVTQDGTASVAVKASPGAACTIAVAYKSGPSKAAGLEPKAADARGQVSWSWKVTASTSKGTWPVTIRCGEQGAYTTVTVK
jgi:endonuclease YncB( thermonuclease family)